VLYEVETFLKNSEFIGYLNISLPVLATEGSPSSLQQNTVCHYPVPNLPSLQLPILFLQNPF